MSIFRSAGGRFLWGAALLGAVGAARAAQVRPRPLPVNEPTQVTSEFDPVSAAAVSPDGRWLVYAVGPEGARDLWLRSADPGVVVLPRRITTDPADESAPAFAPDGRRLAYVGTADDARGDLYLLDLDAEGRPAGAPVRLTGRAAAEAAPAFGPDGATLYFERTAPGPGGGEPRLAVLDPARPEAVRDLGEGTSPAPSPDGTRLAFVDTRDDPGGDLFVLDPASGRATPLTAGPALDAAPAWAPDGALLFVRRALDTDRDGWVTRADRGVLWRLADPAPEAALSGSAAHPVTSSAHSAEAPRPVGGILFFLSPRGGVANVWSLPAAGEVPDRADPEAQLAAARELDAHLPPDPALALVAYERVLERFPRAEPWAARAGYAVGRLYAAMGRTEAAEAAFERTARDHAGTTEAALARLRLAGLRARRAAAGGGGDAAALERGLAALDAVGADVPDRDRVRARAGVEAGRLLLDLGRDPGTLLRAVERLEEVADRYPEAREEAAEALFLRAEAFARVGRAERLQPAYRTVLERYPDVERWADRAVDRLLDRTEAAVVEDRLDSRVEALRRLAEENRDDLPRLAMGAWNRIGDRLYAAAEGARAKEAYRHVLEEFPPGTTQTAAARLALAEILYREERFRQALDLYETELAERPPEDHIYRLARRGYIRRTVEAGEFLLRTGEVLSARSLFRDLLRYDDGVVEAHRGYIRASAALGDLDAVIAAYRARVAADPGDAVALYATGLALTYRETRAALEEARGLILEAIARRGQVEYFHQTLGYVLEVLETVHGQKGNLELALDAYRKAYFLNDHEANPANAANLLLNQGNAAFLLGQYRAAARHYGDRLASGIAFDDPETEILFYRRFGAAAFQVGEPERAADLLEKAVGLVRERTDPKRASREYDALVRAVLDRVLVPAPGEASSPDAEPLAEAQSAVRERLFGLTRADVAHVPSPEWEAYRSGVEALLAEQEALDRRVVAWVRDRRGDAAADETRRSLGLLAGRVRDALAAPGRLVELRVELLDRLALADQEAGRWERAAAGFDAALDLNRRLGHRKNLARNRRSAAYNRYRLAGERAGAERVRLLEEAAAGFREAVELVRRHGVAAPVRPAAGGGLVNLDLQLSLDAAGATQAAYGFTAEQEERLTEAFLARIALELGDLGAAQDALAAQLDRYPEGQAVAEADLHGVSLLEHRAGLLAFARGDPADAFERFRRSAALARRLGNAASAALNGEDLARAAVALDPADPRRPDLLRELAREDRRITALLDRDPTVSAQPAAVRYHTALGLRWLEAAEAGPGSGEGETVPAAVVRARALERAAIHARIGLRLLGEPTDREGLARAARLHLNLARALDGLGADASGDRREALRLAEQGLLPGLAWRALAGLGRREEALAALEAVSPLRAHAAPGEITGAFAPLVAARFDAGREEEAFDLAERLAELERVHRLAPLTVGALTEAERDLCRRVYPRLLRVRELRAAAATAEGEEAAYRREALSREERLLAADLGEHRERLPALAAAAGSEEARDAVVILVGLALDAERAADAAVGAPAEEGAARRAEADALRERFDAVRRAAVAAGAPDDPAGPLALLGPEPAAAAELVEALPEDVILVRLVGPVDPVGQDGSGAGVGRFLRFTLAAGAFEAERTESADPGDPVGSAPDGRLVLAHDDPAVLPRVDGAAYAFSGTHWLRAFRARKPFKRSLVLVPPSPGGAPAGFELVPVDAAPKPGEVAAAAAQAHTLVLGGPVRLATGVPTRAGEVAAPVLAAALPGGRRLSLADLLGHLPRASAAVFPAAEPAAAYAAAQLLGLAGCPSVLVPDSRDGGDDSAADPTAFLVAYVEASAAGAAPRGWLVLGYGGMGPEEARALAATRFVGYARAAQAALRGGRPAEALASAEDALRVARDSAAFDRYRTDLYRFAREAAWAAGHYEAAARYAEALADRLAETVPDSAAHAEALLRLGLIQARLERYDRAVATLEAAQDRFAALDLPADRVETLSSLGVVLENATEYDRALQAYRSAAELGRSLDREGLLAAQYTNLGRLYDLRLSRWAVARQAYERALALYDASGDAAGVAQALVDVGRCERLLGNFPAAAARYDQALEVLADAPDPVLRAKVVIEQANNAWFQGRYQEAFDLQREASRLARENGWALGEVLALNTSGLTWWTLGDHDRALRELDRALERARDLPGRDDEVATALNNRGLVYREMGRFDDAEAALNDALTIDRRLGSRWAVAYDLRNLGLTRLRRGDRAGALPLLRQAATEAGAIGDRVNEAKALLALGDALRDGVPAEAAEAYRAALERARAMSLREVEWRALHGLALLRLGAGDLPGAKGLLTEAVEVVEGLRAAIRLEQLRDGFLADKMSVYEDLVRVLVGLGDPVGAFEVAERSRSRNFIDLLGNQRLTLRGAVDQEFYERERTLKARMEEQRALLAQAASEAERREYGEALRRLEDEHRDLLLEIQAENPELASLVSVPPLRAEDVRRLLEPGTVLLAYYLLADEVLCWVVRPDGVDLVRTPARRADLEEAVFEYRRRIQNLEPLETRSRELYDLLVAPVLPALEGARRLGIIPHRALHYLSFATLAGPRGDLIDAYALFHLPSASVLEYTVGRRVEEANRRVLAIGNPELGTPALELPFAEQEVGTIRWNFPDVTVLTGERATESWVTAHVGGFGIVHLASHGEFDPINPLFSAVKLARDPAADGDLQAEEVFGLELHADLVVLSACQTGLGKVTRGDDVIGLNRAFFYAGTHAVMSSLWRVSDLSTALLMKHFYRQLADHDKADSLRAAILQVKSRYPHPGYWGAFTLSGDYE